MSVNMYILIYINNLAQQNNSTMLWQYRFCLPKTNPLHTLLGQVCSVYSVNSMVTSHLCSNGVLSPWRVSCQHPSGSWLSRVFLCPVATSLATGTLHDSYPPETELKRKKRKEGYFYVKSKLLFKKFIIKQTCYSTFLRQQHSAHTVTVIRKT